MTPNRILNWVALVLAWSCALFLTACRTGHVSSLDWIAISPDKHGFVRVESGRKFTPWGFNYDRDHKLRLLEDYWDMEWETVAQDFREMKALEGNVVRIHLQFGKFMDAPDQPNEHALEQLGRLLKLAEKTGLYLDLTGLGCYRKKDVPQWYDELDEPARWRAQAKFWEAIASAGKDSPAIFCYDLMNEPIVPGKPRGTNDWLAGQLAGFYYVQAIALDPAERSRHDIARQWIAQQTAAIRKQDSRHLITIGLLPMIGSGFDPKEISAGIDFVSIHLYPKTGEFEAERKTLEQFNTGKPLVIEEIFPINASAKELQEFIKASRPPVSGWISFYWGETPAELVESSKARDKLLVEWLKAFRELRPKME